MTDLCNVVDSNYSFFGQSEEPSYETASELSAQAEKAIENGDFDRAIEIIVALDQKHYRGKLYPKTFATLLEKLWIKNPLQAERVAELVKESWTISVKGDLVYYD